MKTNQEIALEVAKALRQDDLVASLELCTRFLAAVDAERGKDAVGYDEIFNAIAEAASPCGEGIGVSVKAFKRAIGGEIFLSPTIPEGECGCKLVPDYDAIRDAERYRFLRDEENWVDDDPDFAIRPWETLGESSGKEFDSTIDSYMKHRKAMIQAAGVTK